MEIFMVYFRNAWSVFLPKLRKALVCCCGV